LKFEDCKFGLTLPQIAEIREVAGGSQAHRAQPAIARGRRPPRAKVRKVPGHLSQRFISDYR
jgi:hypothetical protein